jgi:hypothetical protein
VPYLSVIVMVVGVVECVVLGSHDWLRVTPLRSEMRAKYENTKLSIYVIINKDWCHISGAHIKLTTPSWMLVAQTPEEHVCEVVNRDEEQADDVRRGLGKRQREGQKVGYERNNQSINPSIHQSNI